MDDLHIYRLKLPKGINEMTVPDDDGYTIYIDSELTANDARKSLYHAMSHIICNDFEKTTVNEIEFENHGESVLNDLDVPMNVKFID